VYPFLFSPQVSSSFTYPLKYDEALPLNFSLWAARRSSPQTLIFFFPQRPRPGAPLNQTGPFPNVESSCNPIEKSFFTYPLCLVRGEGLLDFVPASARLPPSPYFNHRRSPLLADASPPISFFKEGGFFFDLLDAPFTFLFV